MMDKSTAAKPAIFILSFSVALGTDWLGLKKLATKSEESQENSCHAVHCHRQKISPSFLGMLVMNHMSSVLPTAELHFPSVEAESLF